jgi:hypothetical protein
VWVAVIINNDNNNMCVRISLTFFLSNSQVFISFARQQESETMLRAVPSSSRRVGGSTNPLISGNRGYSTDANKSNYRSRAIDATL